MSVKTESYEAIKAVRKFEFEASVQAAEKRRLFDSTHQLPTVRMILITWGASFLVLVASVVFVITPLCLVHMPAMSLASVCFLLLKMAILVERPAIRHSIALTTVVISFTAWLFSVLSLIMLALEAAFTLAPGQDLGQVGYIDAYTITAPVLTWITLFVALFSCTYCTLALLSGFSIILPDTCPKPYPIKV